MSGTPYVHQTIEEYLEVAASGSSVPGGGSVSAMAGALGTTMASMAANFTIGKKKFVKVEAEAKAILDSLASARERLLADAQADAEAYSQVRAAYAMPKDSDEEKSVRADAIENALQIAMTPPMDAFETAVEALRATRHLVEIANPNLLTDVGVAALLLNAAARAAYLNVAVNLYGMSDTALVVRTRTRCTSLLEEARVAAAEVEVVVARSLDRNA